MGNLQRDRLRENRKIPLLVRQIVIVKDADGFPFDRIERWSCFYL